MLRFFRQIRKKLLENGNLRKYFWYALGEILLVMIGILLALQVNNWNEKRISNQYEIELLLNLQNEFNRNLNVLDSVIAINSANISGAKLFAEHLTPNDVAISEKEFAELWDKTFKVEAIYRPGIGTLTEAINSGNLSLINDLHLKSLLSSWNSEYEQLQVQEAIVLDVRMDCYQMLREIGSFRAILDHTSTTETWYTLDSTKFTVSNLDLLKSPQFENDLILFIGTSVFHEKKYLNPMKQNIVNIIDLITKQLEN